MNPKTFQRRILQKSKMLLSGGRVSLWLECSHSKIVQPSEAPKTGEYTHCAVCERNESEVRK